MVLIFCKKIEVISCDFWGLFLDIAKLLFPQADVVGDRFHWTMYINKVLDEQREAKLTQIRVVKCQIWSTYFRHAHLHFLPHLL